MKAVVVDNLSKTYVSGKRALDNVSFVLEEGEIFGFLGPNGAGKTTTVKLLNGMLSPSMGTCRVFDLDPSGSPASMHKLSGVITEHAQMYDNLTGLQNLIFYGTIFGMNAKDSGERALTLLDSLNLTDAKDQRLAAYSTGMRQRLSLARAMIHRPKILFLDEPTSGLDPESAHSVNSMIHNLAKDKGTTVFLCTHQLRYAQEICTNYGLIDEGVLLATGDIDKLREMVFSGVTVTIKADHYPEGINGLQNDDGTREIQVISEEEIPYIVRRIMESGGNVYHVSARKLSLEEIYFSLTRRRKEQKEAEK